MPLFVKIKSCLRIEYLLLLMILLFVIQCKKESNNTVMVKGVYGNPKPFWDKNIKLKDLGVNAIFVHSGSIDSKMMKRAKEQGLKIFAEFALLNGKNYVKTHPEAWAINQNGEKVQPASWFMGVCPTEPGFRNYRFEQLRKLLFEHDVDGVWMDYVHWHAQFEDSEPELPETCFCTGCIERFSNSYGLKVPQGSTMEKSQWILGNHDAKWRDWRCQIIYEWTVDVKIILKSIKPNALLGLYHCPWNDEEFDGARRRILGLDYDLLKESIDVFSPMVYHKRMGNDPEWVKENINWFSKRLDLRKDSYPKVWPIVQAYNDPGIISKEEFEIVLRGGMEGESSGVMMFTSYAVAEDEDKIEVMKEVYQSVIQKKR